MNEIKTRSLTVAILTYNRREYLYECLLSLTRQTFKDFEVIVFDNASDYDIQEFVSTFPQLSITVDRNEINIGGLANFKKVTAYDFQTPYVMMFHDDDTMHPDYLRRALAFLDSHPKAVWVGSNIRFVENATPEKMKYFRPCDTHSDFFEVEEQNLIEKLLGGFNLGFGSVIYRVETFRRIIVRGEEFDKWLDRPLLVDLSMDATVGLTEFQYINYRVHEGQDSQHVEPLKMKNALNLFKYYKEKSTRTGSRKYKIMETTNTINTAFHVAEDFTVFFSIINRFKNEGLFQTRHIGLRGIYYFFRFLLKYCRKRAREIYLSSVGE